MTDLLALPRNALAAALGLGTALRGARVFHPHGRTYACRVEVDGGGTWGAALLDDAGSTQGLVRLSRGAGLPRPLPDVEGLALRLPGRGVGGAPLDLLVNTAWRYVFVPRVVAPTWSCVLPYRTGTGRVVLVGARPTREGFDLLAAAPLGGWERWGRLVLGAPLDGEDLAFAPTVGAPDLQPVPLFRALRERAYDVSQAVRGQSTGSTSSGPDEPDTTSARPATSRTAAGTASSGGR